jgi:hypothetical protein
MSARDALLATWFLKARKKSAAVVPLHPAPREIASKLRVQRRDVGGDVMSELGFGFEVWSGGNVSLDITIGAFNQFVLNSAVLSFRDPSETRSLGEMRSFMAAAIDAFDPEHAVVTSTELLTRRKAQKPWQVGWLTYDRGGEVMEHRVDE